MKIKKISGKLCCSIYVCLLILSSGSLLQAGGDPGLAKRYYSEGRFQEALIEFERIIYNENEALSTSLCRYYKSLCYKNLSRYEKALNELDMINTGMEPDSFFIAVTHEKVLCGYLNNDMNRAMHETGNMYRRITDTLLLMDFIPIQIICLNSVRQWENALCLWDFYIDNNGLSDSSRGKIKNTVHGAYAENNRPVYYSPDKAGRLSTFLPGTGQLYCGKALEGAFSLALNAGLFYFSLEGILSEYYFTGNYLAGKLFVNFYKGGIRRARNLAEMKNEEEIRKFNSLMSQLMLDIPGM